MNKITFLFVLLYSFCAFSQDSTIKDDWIKKYEYEYENGFEQRSDNSFLESNDCSILFKSNPDKYIGLIGTKKKKLDFVITSAIKNPQSIDAYLLSGFTIVGDNKRCFSGEVKIENILFNKKLDLGIDDWMKDSIKTQGIIIGKYTLYENPEETYTGVFTGEFLCKWYINKNNVIHYDNINIDSDSYFNNCFVGNWTCFKTKKTSVANWGQYRIPCSGDLDIGAAEFMPNPKYYDAGWRDYIP